MASRYKLRNGETVFNHNGRIVQAGADGWVRPVDSAMEQALIQAGAQPAGAVTSEDAQGAPNPLQIPRDGSLGNGQGGGGGNFTLTPWDAAQNIPALSSGTAPAGGLRNFIVQNAGITLLGTSVDSISAVRQNDQLTYVDALGKFVRYTDSYAAPVPINGGAITLNDGYQDLVIYATNNPTINLNIGAVSPGFQCTVVGAFTMGGTAAPTGNNDQRQATGAAIVSMSFVNIAQDQYLAIGSK